MIRPTSSSGRLWAHYVKLRAEADALFDAADKLEFGGEKNRVLLDQGYATVLRSHGLREQIAAADAEGLAGLVLQLRVAAEAVYCTFADENAIIMRKALTALEMMVGLAPDPRVEELGVEYDLA